MKRIIENFSHHKDDYECMWNGIEDIYINKTKAEIPDQFFFGMSGFGGFAYIKTNRADEKRLVSFGEGRTRQMYQFLGPIAGFDYQFIESKTPELALAKAKKEIDAGYPVVIGALDMYYLDYYEKLYHRNHIPFHYVLMVGYDDAEAEIYVFDCGREERLALSYDNLLLALGAQYAGLSKPNTICKIRMEHPNSQRSIIKTALTYRAGLFVNPPTSFLGVNGMRKLAKELPGWENELGRGETAKILRRMAEFFGSVPQTPNRLLGIDEEDDITYMCSRDKMSRLYGGLGAEYNSVQLKDASGLFSESGQIFEKLCDTFIEYILEEREDLGDVGNDILRVADLEYKAFSLILKGVAAF